MDTQKNKQMTKEEILKRHWGIIPLINSLNEPDPIYTAMDEFARQQAIAFAIHYAKSAIQNGYVKPSAVEDDRIEERYAQFIEQQQKP